MIETLDDLAAYTRRKAERLPIPAAEVLLQPPGVSDAEIARLQEAVGDLPDSYLDCIRRFSLAGVAIGYFELSPVRPVDESLVDALIRANGPDEAFAEQVRRALVIVASFEADPLCVARSGEVIRINLDYGPSPILTSAAPAFDQLLIAAGRLDEVAASPETHETTDAIVASLTPFTPSPEQQENWRFFAVSTIGA
jgi:hypothetical protein